MSNESQTELATTTKAAVSKNSKLVDLEIPMLVDGQEVTQIELRKPNSGNLRGLSLINIGEMDFDTHITLLPRISKLNEREVLNIEPENFAPLMTGIAHFFVNTEG